jgi:ABC-2 type transport system permease protein
VANDKDLLKYKYLSNSQKPGKVLLIGNGRFIANSLRPDERGMPRPYFPSLAADEEMTIYSRSYVLIGNQEFFQNMVDYMMDESSVIGLRSRKVDINALDKNKLKKDAQFYKLLNIIVPVLLVAVLAVLMLLFRKRKYAK